MKKFLSFIMCAAMISGSLVCVHADVTLQDITEMNAQDDKSIKIIDDDIDLGTGDDFYGFTDDYIDSDTSVGAATDVAIPVYDIMPSTKVLIIGDSNAYGYGLTLGTVESGLAIGSFADVFASKMLKDNQTAEMFAAPGATLQSLVNIIEDPEKSVVLANALNQVDIVDINLGGNDLLYVLRGINAGNAATASGDAVPDTTLDTAGLTKTITDSYEVAVKKIDLNLSKVMEFVNSLDKVPYVAVNAVPTPDTTKLTQYLSDDAKAIFGSIFTDEYVAAIVESANNALKHANVRFKSTFVDTTGLPLTTQDDGIHFDLDGHEALGEQIFTNASEVIKEDKIKNLLLFRSVKEIFID